MLVLIGEDALGKKSHEKLDEVILKLKPFSVIHWRLGDDHLTTAKQAHDAISKAKDGTHCDPRYNLDVYRLANKLLPKTKFFGCDPDFRKYSEHIEQYWNSQTLIHKREIGISKEIIKYYKTTSKRSSIVIAVVDSKLLRKQGSPDYKKFGPSKLLLELDRYDWPLAIFDAESIFGKTVKEISDILSSVDASNYLPD